MYLCSVWCRIVNKASRVGIGDPGQGLLLPSRTVREISFQQWTRTWLFASLLACEQQSSTNFFFNLESSICCIVNLKKKKKRKENVLFSAYFFSSFSYRFLFLLSVNWYIINNPCFSSDLIDLCLPACLPVSSFLRYYRHRVFFSSSSSSSYPLSCSIIYKCASINRYASVAFSRYGRTRVQRFSLSHLLYFSSLVNIRTLPATRIVRSISHAGLFFFSVHRKWSSS